MKIKPVFLILFLGFIPLLDLLHPGLPLTHDGQDHVARIANFYQSLSEGNLIPRWAGNLNWGYGHPILMFLYPLPSYVSSFFHFLGFTLVDSIKIVFGLSLILSGVFMYLWIKELWGELAGLTAGIVYMFAPYRFVDLYVRGAIGECWAFVWAPLIFYFVFKLGRSGKLIYLIGISFSLAFLILSHNALSLLFLPVILGYMVFLFYKKNKDIRLVGNYLISLVLGLGLSAFFWLPAFFEGKYTLRDIVTKGQISGFESVSRLLWSNWNYGGTGVFSVQVGFIQWGVIILAPFLIWLLFKKKDSLWIFLLFLFGLFMSSIILMLSISRDLYLLIPMLQKFQFTWRFLSLAIFPPAVFAGVLVYFCPRKQQKLVVGLLLLGSLYFNKDYWSARDYLYKSEIFYKEIYNGTTDTGESAPRWSVRFMEKRPISHMEIIMGKATINELERSSTYRLYEIEAKEKTRIRENTLYFPGWTILIDNQPVNIEFQDIENRGLMTFYVDKGYHMVIVQFKETKLRFVSDIITLVSLSLSLLFVVTLIIVKINKFKVHK